MATNAEWMVKNGYNFINLRAFDADNANRAYKIGLCMVGYTWEWVGEVTEVYHDKSTAVLAWLDQEHKEPILDEAERAYLSAVIRPFRKSVISIEKSTIYGEGEVICIDTEKSDIVLPPFEEGTMYDGMEVGREYTLEELGL